MYIYFDVNGNLREIVSNSVREGSYNDNEIFIYVESQNPAVDVNGTFTLPSSYPNGKISFANLDTGNSLNGNDGTPLAMTTLTGNDAFEIPYDRKRDLKHFKYGYKYEGYMIVLPATVTAEAGVVIATAYIYNIGAQKALNTFTFNVEVSVGIVLGSTMSESQYSYLYNILQSYINLQVPYIGATRSLELGEYDLIAKDVSAYNGELTVVVNVGESQGTTYYGLDHIEMIRSGLDYSFVFPELDDEEEQTIATQEWCNNRFYISDFDKQLNTSELIVYAGPDAPLGITERIVIGPSDWELEIKRDRIVKHVDGSVNNYLFDATDSSSGTYILATQEWVKARHNGIYEVSSDFFPYDSDTHQITLDVDTLKDIVENANALVEVDDGVSYVRKYRRRITYCEVGYASDGTTITDVQMVYGEDYPENNASHHYIYYKQAWKLTKNNTGTFIKLILNVDNS